ncbi:MAG: TrmH family RNA methyltransferase [Thermoleophilia bacterium]|nr:TrmH family RNA methyltransferase [Thermoleophilia bacterium]
MPERSNSKLIVVAHDIRSLANVGALFRTCDGAGVSELVLSGFTGTPPDRRIDKVALGAVEMVPWRHAPEPEDLERVLEGRYVVVLEQHERAVPPGDLQVPADRDVVLVACEELFGARDELIERADALLELPMRGRKDSLNVSVAAAIGMYHLADRMFGTPASDLASRQDRPPVREGVLTRGVTQGHERDHVPPPDRGTQLVD